LRVRRRRSAAPLALALCAALCARAASDDDATPERQVDALVREHGVKADGPGVGVLVVTRKGVQVKKGYGVANLAKKTPITAATTFELASVSKQFTGAAVLLLVQRGKVGVADDVRKHLPELPRYDAAHPITVDHLSRHTSGLPDYIAWAGEPPTKKPYYTNADVLPEFARRKEASPLEFRPGEKYEYSNSGYMVLASLVERVSGVSYGAFLAKEYFEPLGMKSAWVHESPRVPTVATAVGYTKDDDAWRPTWSAPTAERHEELLTVGDGSVWASLDDMAAWDGGLRSGKPLKAETLLGALAPGRTRDGERLSYAMGWVVEHGEKDAVTAMSHNGSWQGFETFIGHDVAHEITVVVLSNRGGFDAAGLAAEVGALFQK